MSTSKKNLKKKNKRKKFAFKKLLAYIPLLGLISSCFFGIYDIYANNNSKSAYVTNTQLLSAKSAYEVLTDYSKLQIVYDQSYNEDHFDSGVFFNVAFSNRLDYDRIIKKFTVKATNIELDIAPYVTGYSNISNNSVTANLTNYGWGTAKKTEIHIKNISSEQIIFKEQKLITIEDLKPGETKNIELFSFNDLKIDSSFTSEIVTFTFEIICDGQLQETLITVVAEVNTNFIRDNIDGRGDGGDSIYAIIIDVSKKKVLNHYSVEQIVPASKTILLPVFIIPTQSCSMTLELIFTMEDGEEIQYKVFHNKKFRIPYNTNPLLENINLLTNNWGNEIVCCFPFSKSEQIIDSDIIEKLENK